MLKISLSVVAITFTALLTSGTASAANPEIEKLQKRCELGFAKQGMSGRSCACTLKNLQESYSDEQIIMFSKRDYKARTAEEKFLQFQYSNKLKMMTAHCPT